MGFDIDAERIAAENAGRLEALQEDYDHLGLQLARRNVDIEALTERALAFRVAVPSWGVGTGGTRFARFPGPGEPRNVFEKIEDCEVVFKLVRSTPGISLHIPWDRPESASVLRTFAESRGLFIESMNSNTFQDQPGQAALVQVRQPCARRCGRPASSHRSQHRVSPLGLDLGARSHTVWIGDGSNFPGQLHFRKALDRYLDSLRAIYEKLPEGWRLFLEHKPYEPAFYSTVLGDWGTSYYCARELGSRAFSLVDLGHHVPNTNVEQVVSRLIHFGKLGGFHFNDNEYGDDDLDTGSVKPFQLFLVFNELVDAELEGLPDFDPAYMLDQSHNVTDPIESLMTSSIELVRAYVQAHMVDREKLASYQASNDPLMALQTLKEAFTTDVGPVLAMARYRAGGAIDPVAVYRASGYRLRVQRARPAEAHNRVGIV